MDERPLTRAETVLADLAVVIVTGGPDGPLRVWSDVLARHLEAVPQAHKRLVPVRQVLDRLCEAWAAGADDWRLRFDLGVAVRQFFEARYCRATAPPADGQAA